MLDGNADGAVAKLFAFGGDGKDVENEQLRHELLVILMYLESAVHPAGCPANRCLGFDEDQRQTVHQQHQIGPLFRRSRTEGVLRGNDIIVPVRICA